jgi:hypothetical protein
MQGNFPSSYGGTDGSFSMYGAVKVPDFVLHGGDIGYALGAPSNTHIGCPLPTLGPPTGLDLGHGVHVNAQLNSVGPVTSSSITLFGTGSISYPAIPLIGSTGGTGNIELTDSDVTACAQATNSQGNTGWYGFNYSWATGSFQSYRGNCPLQAPPS